MVCSKSCAITIIFLIAMFYMNYTSYSNDTVNNYKKQLPEDLKDIYDSIVKERLGIYYTGYFLGFIISLFIILYNYKLTEGKLSTISIICLVLSTCFIVNYFYYLICPKKKWMLDYIKTPEQTKAWLEMYRQMQLNYHIGLLLGLVAVAFLAITFRC